MYNKILFLVPDATMVAYTESVLKEERLEIPVEHGMWIGGIDIARKYVAQGFDVIVARAGTANLIRNANLGLSVVELPLTGIDIIRAVEKARLFGKRIAVVAFQSMVLGIEYAAKILDTEIGYFYISSSEEIETVLGVTVAQGYDVVLGGALTATACRTHNLPYVFIESSRDSILQAAFESIRIEDALETEKYKRTLFSAVLDYAHDGIITVDSNGIVTSINPTAVTITGFKQAIGKSIQTLWPSLALEKVITTKREELNQLYKVNGVQITCNKVPIVVNNLPAGAIATFQDITKIQQLEAHIRQEVYAKGHVTRFTFDDIWGKSHTIQQTLTIAKDYARTNSNILILGETGVGKEVFAQSIHNYSCRSNGPFVAINCAALPGQILESELFGYVRGAFTGANKEGKPGIFEVAHGGTIFLDEIAELDYVNQGRLLRVLQERAVVRLGSDRVIPVHVRVIAATNKDLSQAVAQKKFRDDLFYRLNVLKLHLPTLHERKADIQIYAKNFLAQYTRANGRTLTFTPTALKLMDKYDWPGNIRQLQNTIERAVVICKETEISKATLSLCLDQPEDINTYQTVSAGKRDEIVDALTLAKGQLGEAAKTLGINRSTLWRRMQRLGLPSPK